VKPLWTRQGQLTEHGERLSEKAEQWVFRFIRSIQATGRDILDVELILQRAVAFQATMARVRSFPDEHSRAKSRKR
jgi:hypothetical protein